MSHNSGGNDQIDGAASKEKEIEDSQTDSGFISSSNIVVSSDSIDSYIEEQRRIHDGEITSQPDETKDSSSNLALDKDLGKLSLKDDTTENQFDSGIIDAPSEDFISGDLDGIEIDDTYEPPKNITLLPWQLYYTQDNDGDTQLHLSIIQEFKEAAFYLIEIAPHPYLLDVQNDDWDSALHLAVLTKQPVIVRKLILAGANPRVRNFQGDTPLHNACDMGNVECVKALTSPLTPIELSSLGNKKLTNLPIDLHLRNYTGQMCLHLAAKKGHIDVIRHLVNLGVDVNAREALSGHTALHLAIVRKLNDVALFLVDECRARLDSKMYNGRSAYGLARRLDPKLADDLIKHGNKPSKPFEFSSDEESEDEHMEDEDSDDDDVEGEQEFREAVEKLNRPKPLVT